MKLIPIALYDKLMKQQQHEPMDVTLPSTDVLESELPEEVKLKLYHHKQRTLAKEELVQKNTPIPVMSMTQAQIKNSDSIQEDPVPFPLVKTPLVEPPTSIIQTEECPETPKSRKSKSAKPIKSRILETDRKISSFLYDQGIRPNAEGEVRIGKRVIPSSSYLKCVQQLSDARRKRTTPTREIMKQLSKIEIPDDLFSAGIMNAIKGKHDKSTNQISPKTLQWETY